MKIFVDESGDLGWTFDKPFRLGGSSRYLTVACLVVPQPHYRHPKKLIVNLYKKYGWKSEKKASDATYAQKLEFCASVKTLLQRYPEIKLDVITVKKSNVQKHIQEDANKLYNYMLGLVIPGYVATEEEFALIADERSIKVKSMNSLKDYLQIKLWFEIKCSTCVKYYPTSSDQSYALQFADWVAHCIWEHYEDGLDVFFSELKDVAKIRPLFF